MATRCRKTSSSTSFTAKDRPSRTSQSASQLVAGVAHDVHDGRQWRDTPDHRHGAVFRVQRQRHPVGVDERVDRSPARGLDPVPLDACAFGFALHPRVFRIEQDAALGVVEHEADVAQTLDASRVIRLWSSRPASQTLLRPVPLWSTRMVGCIRSVSDIVRGALPAVP